MMSHNEMIAVLTAAAGGAEIEFRSDSKFAWLEAKSPTWNFERFEYRVKPKAREWWINKYDSETLCNMHHSLQDAIKGSMGDCGPELVERIHVREIID